MDFFELDEWLKEQNPGKAIEYDFPLVTHRIYEIVMDNGKPNPHHHVECRQVNVKIEGKDPYIQKLTSPHRLTITMEHMQTILREAFP